MHIIKCGRYIVVGVQLILFFTVGVVAAGEQEYTLCVHPFKASNQILQAFSPLADYLAKSMGKQVTIRVAATYDAHVTAVGMDQCDIGYMGPAPYIKLVELYGKRRLLGRQAINGEPIFRGKIIVRKDSPLKSLRELVGKRFAFGDRDSTMSHLVPQYMLIQAHVGVKALADFEFLGNHTNVALGILSGKFDAGAVKEEVFYQYEARGLRALATSPAISEHLLVASNLLSDALVEKFRQTLLTVHQTPEGLAALQSIKPGMSALVPAQDSDYDNLREIMATLKQHDIVP